MPYYLIEVHMTSAGQLELERVTRLLAAARFRLRTKTKLIRLIASGLSREDSRLLCLMEASTPDAARHLVAVALLPAGRVREITPLSFGDLVAGRHPRGDADPGTEAELVEDVVDVGLDGALGEE